MEQKNKNKCSLQRIIIVITIIIIEQNWSKQKLIVWNHRFACFTVTHTHYDYVTARPRPHPTVTHIINLTHQPQKIIQQIKKKILPVHIQLKKC